MFQRFFTTTVVGNFIKALLQSTPLPKYKTVRDGDHIREGFVYLYGIRMIKCTRTGNVGDTAQYTIIRNAFEDPSDHSGTFFWGEKYNNRTDHIHSLNAYYDEDTHEALGNYLRCYRDLKGIDLMPFYNCFSYRMATDFYLEKTKPGYEIKGSFEDKYKVMLIPINFDQKYTVYLDSISHVVMKPVIYNNGIVRDWKSSNIIGERINCTVNGATTAMTYCLFQQMSFSNPVVVNVVLPDDETKDDETKALLDVAYSQEKNLYLAIQTSRDNLSSIVVLEGDYRDGVRWESKNIENDDVSIVPVNNMISNLSLTRMNDGNIYAFSNRLVEYLLKNVIDSDDTIDENTVRVQEKAKELFGYSGRANGVYDDDLKELIFSKYLREKNPNALDITGYTDKDIEGWLQI